MQFQCFRLCVFLVLIGLIACSDDSGSADFPFERSVLELSAVKRCVEKSTLPGDPCYQLKWRHPIEKEKLVRYHIWIDTTVVGDSARAVPDGALNQSIQVDFVAGRGDYDSLDLTARLTPYLERDSLHVAIWAEYDDGSDPGAIQRLFLFFGDDIPPGRVLLSDSSDARSIWLEWTRPTDQVDFYFPDSQSGPIAGYNLHIYANDASEDIRNVSVRMVVSNGRPVSATDSSQWIRHQRWRLVDDSLVLNPTSSDEANRNHLRLAILDGKGFHANPDSNRFRLQITGLSPEKLYGVGISVWDSSGNYTGTDANASGRQVLTTDTVAPLMATRFWLRPDTLDGAKPRLDSNRLVLFWPRSLDPLAPMSGITLDSVLSIPPSCWVGSCYREVASYKVDLWDGTAWVSAPRAGGSVADKYSERFALQADTMAYSLTGDYVSDTLRWVVPGDTVVVRVRAVDVSGYISRALVDTLVVSRGPLWKVDCPLGYVPVQRSTRVEGESVVEAYCVERYEHQKEGTFVRNVLYSDARAQCQGLSGSPGFEGYQVDLCTETHWQSACTSEGRSRYGTIQEEPFTALEFLFQRCNVGTWDSLSATRLAHRDPLCVSPDGVRDLPGHLQEWVVGTVSVYDSTLKETRLDTIPVLKGTSYVLFSGADRTSLAQCAVRTRPYRVRPDYTQDTVWLYRNGSTVDTLFARDTSRTLYTSVAPSHFNDTLLFYTLSHSVSGKTLGTDYVDQAEYRRRGGEAWLKVLWAGLTYQLQEKRKVLIRGTIQDQTVVDFYSEPSVGFRCCAFSSESN